MAARTVVLSVLQHPAGDAPLDVSSASAAAWQPQGLKNPAAQTYADSHTPFSPTLDIKLLTASSASDVQIASDQ